jgi:hypothetical protein
VKVATCAVNGAPADAPIVAPVAVRGASVTTVPATGWLPMM